MTHNFLSVMDATPSNRFPQQFKFHRRHQTPLGKHSPTFASFHCASFTSHVEMKHRQAPSKIAHCNLFPTPRTTQEKQPGQSGYLNQRSQQLLLFPHSVPVLFPLSIRPIMVGNKPYKKNLPRKNGTDFYKYFLSQLHATVPEHHAINSSGQLFTDKFLHLLLMGFHALQKFELSL